MAGMCKSDATQNSKNRNKFQAQVNRNTWETHKDKKAKIVAHKKELAASRAAKRLMQGKPQRGDARRVRRLADGINVAFA